jgi:hypothetical protein
MRLTRVLSKCVAQNRGANSLTSESAIEEVAPDQSLG